MFKGETIRIVPTDAGDCFAGSADGWQMQMNGGESMNSLLLGIDVGTSSCKAALFDMSGQVIAQESTEYRVYYPEPNHVEQDPTDWWQGVCAAIKALLTNNNIDPHRIEGVGIAGQSWSAIPLSKDGESLCPSPIWMDTRAEGLCRQLEKRLGKEKIFEVCGNPLQPTYALPKVLWYKVYRPEIYQKADKILGSNGYIAYRLTGAVTLDKCQAYGFHCFSMRNGVWDEPLCAEMGIRRNLLPEIVPCHQIIGNVTEAAARQCGLIPGTPVVAGGLDAACGALGAGVLNDGETQEQGGQAGGMSICTDRYYANDALILSFHVVPGRWLLQGGTVGGGGIMRWLQKDLWPNKTMKALDEEAMTVPPGSDGLIFLPYMAGERSPIWDTKAKGVYFGLDYTKSRKHMVRAGLEGAAYALRHNLEAAEQAGAKVARLRAMGGAANSLLWTQIKADITGKPIDVPSSDVATTLGAALLAGVAVGVYQDFTDAVSRTVTITRTHEPCMDNSGLYHQGYAVYRELYSNLKDLMRKG